MRNVTRFVRLDLFAMLPYARALALVGGVLVIVAFIAQFDALVAVATVTMAGLVLFPSYLFALDERAGLDRLYGILPTTRRTVVAGRYASLLLGLLAALAGGTGLGIALALTFHTSLAGLGATLALLAALSVTLLAVQVPLFFRFGYLRARFVSYALIVAVAVIPAGLLSLSGLDLVAIAPPPALTAGAAGVGAVLLLAASVALSLRWYRMREF